MKSLAPLSAVFLALCIGLGFSTPVQAGLTVCNQTPARIGAMIASGPNGSNDSEVRGPFMVEAGQCQEIINENLQLRSGLTGYNWEYVAQQVNTQSPLFWTGGPNWRVQAPLADDKYCIDESGNKFDYLHQHEGQSCPAGEEQAAFRSLYSPDMVDDYRVTLAPANANGAGH